MAVAQEKVDLIIHNATIYSVNAAFDKYEAMAIKNGEIANIGSEKDILNNYKSDNKVDCKGKFVYPGFIDAHCHFSGYALERYLCDLKDLNSYAAVIKKVVDYDKTNKLSWIFGRGWDQNRWKVKEFPTKDTLDKLFPGKIVILERVDGHALLCNQKTLDLAGITVDTKIEGGVIEKKNGKLTGILIDNAMDLAKKVIPTLPEDAATTYLKEVEGECYADGLTGVVDCGVKKSVIDLLKELYNNNELEIGNTLLLANDKETFDTYLKQGPQKYGQLQITGIKLYSDGALGSRGACLLQDYNDKPGHRGLIITPVKEMEAVAALAIKYNWQLCTHAIGDSANRTMLQLYAKYLQNKNDRRWRIEHAQVVAPADLHYFKDYSIIPSVQPTHAISDMPWAIDRLGKERLPHAYAYKDLLQQNGWEPLGTDFPVEAIDPLKTFYTAVYRKNAKGEPKNGFLYENAITKEEALKGMTIWAAKSVFRENEKGSLEKGKDADIVILDRDIMGTEQDAIHAKVLYTIVKGDIKYKYNK